MPHGRLPRRGWGLGAPGGVGEDPASETDPEVRAVVDDEVVEGGTVRDRILVADDLMPADAAPARACPDARAVRELRGRV